MYSYKDIVEAPLIFLMKFDVCVQGCSYGGRRRAGPPITHDFRPAQPKKKDFRLAQFFVFLFCLVPGTMFHNRGSIIAQYVIYIENDLVRL